MIRMRVLLAQQVVEQRVFVKVEIGRVRCHRPELASELQHIVRIARLARVVGEIRSDGIRILEMLGLAVAADGVGVLVNRNIPRVLGDVSVLGGPRLLELASGADPFGDLSVCVEPAEPVLV